MAALIGVSVKPKGGGYTCRVPLDLLAEDGTPPEQGDSVSYSVDGTVQSVDAEDAVVKITAVNGEPVDESASDEAAEDAGTGGGGPDLSAMRSKLAAGAKGQPMPF
jgi:hypothetical protein